MSWNSAILRFINHHVYFYGGRLQGCSFFKCLQPCNVESILTRMQRFAEMIKCHNTQVYDEHTRRNNNSEIFLSSDSIKLRRVTRQKTRWRIIYIEWKKFYLLLSKLVSAMCYKSITKKLTNTVDDMLDRNILDKIAGDGSTNKLKVK